MAAKTSQMRICVFCSTQNGNDPAAGEAARLLAQAMNERGAVLVYGGGTTGLMGTLARERVRLGGPEAVIGVTPYALIDSEREGKGKEGLGQTGRLDKLKGLLGGSTQNHNSPSDAQRQRLAPDWDDVVDLPSDPEFGQAVGVPTLSRRKALMVDFVKAGGPGSGFIALPGGFGSLDEILETICLRQLGVHSAQMVLCNTKGAWNGFQMWMDDASRQGFLGDESKAFVSIVETPNLAVEALLQQQRQQQYTSVVRA